MQKYLIEKLKALRQLFVVGSKIKTMSSADKFEIFLKICGVVFVILLILKLLFISISWWIVFLPIIIPIFLILEELGLFRS